ncbi:FCD domain-containing protein, partial [Acinetobacter baumannii]
YFEYRRHTEAVAARLAALRATEIDRAAIAACADRIGRAHELDDPAEEAAADVELHMLIYEAAHNVVMLHVMRVFQEMLRQGVFYNR